MASFRNALAQGEKIHFDSLDFTTVSIAADRFWVDSIATLLQAIHFGSLVFVVDHFGALCIRSGWMPIWMSSSRASWFTLVVLGHLLFMIILQNDKKYITKYCNYKI
jgi:hypothetical protein